MLQRIRRRVFQVLEFSSKDDWLTLIDDVLLTTLIALNAVAVTLETVHSLYSEYKVLFDTFELVSISIFTVEYILRLWICTLRVEYQQPLKGRIRFALTPLALVDLFAILPFYFPYFLPIDLRFLRTLRLFRLLRIFKLTRYSAALRTLGTVVKLKKEELLISVMIVLVILFFASTLMYFIENEVQPETFGSIPKSLWWGVVTLTTVGYGDVYPVTPLGKVLGAVIAFLGVGMFALPAGILASGFADRLHRKQERTTCPHCGKEID